MYFFYKKLFVRVPSTKPKLNSPKFESGGIRSRVPIKSWCWSCSYHITASSTATLNFLKQLQYSRYTPYEHTADIDCYSSSKFAKPSTIIRYLHPQKNIMKLILLLGVFAGKDPPTILNCTSSLLICNFGFWLVTSLRATGAEEAISGPDNFALNLRRNNAVTSLVNCDAGYYRCAAGCVMCPTGTWSSSGSTSCKACPAGQYAKNHLSCVDCQRGEYSRKKSDVCLKCAPGSVSKKKSKSCTCCQAGMYADHVINVCSICPAGTISDASAVVCNSCVPGQYSAPKSQRCEDCCASYYSHTPTQPCLKCPPGQYSKAKAFACASCPPGSEVNALQTGCVATWLTSPSMPTFGTKT